MLTHPSPPLQEWHEKWWWWFFKDSMKHVYFLSLPKNSGQFLLNMKLFWPTFSEIMAINGFTQDSSTSMIFCIEPRLYFRFSNSMIASVTQRKQGGTWNCAKSLVRSPRTLVTFNFWLFINIKIKLYTGVFPGSAHSHLLLTRINEDPLCHCGHYCLLLLYWILINFYFAAAIYFIVEIVCHCGLKNTSKNDDEGIWL